ncbi:hypothetical protein MKW98_022482 [Papaver atlanticum]|uniref:Uncharacterized protein n=1 Tax=Papaver atlanticum TaxID=357466 RepID=A0AAD4T7H9_9MAGN|nr:hypothetical protein MKW98_022482 [Papaver atlanticum]
MFQFLELQFKIIQKYSSASIKDNLQKKTENEYISDEDIENAESLTSMHLQHHLSAEGHLFHIYARTRK